MDGKAKYTAGDWLLGIVAVLALLVAAYAVYSLVRGLFSIAIPGFVLAAALGLIGNRLARGGKK